MKKLKLGLWIFAVICLILAIFFTLQSEYSILTHPKGWIARSEIQLIATNYLLMLIIVIPTFIFLFVVAWRYRATHQKAKYVPDSKHRWWAEVILWAIPAIVIAVMAPLTWKAAHELDPYRPIQSEVKPLTIQVVALDWKWLFIYPEQGIATLNFVQFPEKTPIQFRLSADGSPMNSFWIPQLSGQIYSMTGMTTQLHIIADEVGVYVGRAAEINGEGFADMTFTVKSSSQDDFADWVGWVKQSSLQLTESVYRELVRPSMKNPVVYYSQVEPNLFDHIIMKPMHP